MEVIGQTVSDINKLQQKSSQVEPTAKIIPIEKRRALGDVFDRWRLNCGWNPWDNTTQDMAIASFVESLDREGVPVSAYHELYERAIKVRTTALQQGRNLPSFGVELLLAQWTGDWGLKAELRQREIDRGRTLPANAESICVKCQGTGFEEVKDADGRRLGVRPGCTH